MAYRLEKTNTGTDIVIEGWGDGVAKNPYEGLADIRNLDPSTVPGEISVAMKTEAMITQAPATTVTFTADPATDVLTYNGVVPLEINQAIRVSNSGGALPTGMTSSGVYYVLTTPTSTTFTVSGVSAGGATLNITGTGSGTNTFSVISMGTPKFIRMNNIVPQAGFSGQTLYFWYFLLDSNGRCWVWDDTILSSNTKKWIYMHNLPSEASTEKGNGLIVWKNWVFVFDSSEIRVIPLVNNFISTLAFLTTKGSWADWQSLEFLGTSEISHFALISQQDENIYFANGLSVGSVIEIPGEIFAPNTGRTVANGVTTNGSATITSATIAFTTLDIGSAITGVGIPTGTFIISINSATSAEMSNNATITNVGVTFTIPTSYTFNSDALGIPSSDEVVCLAELGTNLLVGGINNNIYVWDRISIGFNYIIYISENYVARMVTVNTNTYIFAGRRGRVFQTNGSNADLFWKVPDYISNTVNPTFIWTDATFNRNQLYFGFQVATNSGTTINEYGGLWTIDLNTSGGYLSNQLSYGTYSGYASALLAYRGETRGLTSSTGLFGTNTGYGLFVGWNNGSVGGIDQSTSTPYTSGQSYVNSDMIPVGNFLTQKTFSNLEFKLTTPLVSGETFALYYRANMTEAFTNVPITEGGNTGDLSGICSPINFQNTQWLQIRAILTSTASTPSFVRLKEIRIR